MLENIESERCLLIIFSHLKENKKLEALKKKCEKYESENKKLEKENKNLENNMSIIIIN